MLLIAVGVPVGLVSAAGAARLLSAILWGVTTTDASTFVAVVMGLPVVALLAALVPALRVLRLDPRSVLAVD
jgi:ABC-type antimicrobial peptide transport system permease subunit